MLIIPRAVILLAFMAYAHRVDAGEAKPSFLVSSFGLGPAGPAISAKEFASALAGAGWCDARMKPRSRWDTLSPTRGGSVQVSVVTVGFADQAHAFAFLAGRRGKGYTRVAHIPYRRVINRRGEKLWQQPMAALANALFEVWERRDEKGLPRPVARVVVSSGSDQDALPGDGADDLGDLLDAGADHADGEDMLHAQAAQTSMTPLRVMAMAAALEAGWLPEANAATTLSVSARFGFQKCEIRCTRADAGDRRSLVEPAVPEDSYYAQLVRTFRALLPGSGIHDVIRLGGAATPIYASSDRICLVVDGELRAYRAATGEIAWRKPFSGRGAPPAYMRHPTDAAVLRLSAPTAIIDAASGAETGLSAEQVAELTNPGPSAYIFDAETETVAALAAPGGTERWRQAVGDVLVAAPRVCGQALLVATKGNRLMLLNPATGAVLHEVRWPTWLLGVQIVSRTTGTFVVCRDLRGRVAFLSGANLRTLRIVQTGVTLVGEPVHAPCAPLPWPGSAAGDPLAVASPATPTPAVLVCDDAGFCYALRPPPAAGKEGR